jgi:hypothetical protein
LLVGENVREHIKMTIESHGSLKTLFHKIKDLTLEYDEDYQQWLKKRGEDEKQQYGSPQTKTERRVRAELPSRFDGAPGVYCIIKSRGTMYLPNDKTFPPDYTKVYTHTDEVGHAYTANQWNRKQHGMLTEEEFEVEIIRNLPGFFCGAYVMCSGPFVDGDHNCCYVVTWGNERERDQHGNLYRKKFSGEEWVNLTIKGKKQEYRIAPLRNIQYGSLVHIRCISHITT